MLASLTRELARDETDSIVGETMGRGEFTQSPIVKFFDLFKNNNELLAPEHIQAIMVEMYNSRVGHEFARQEAYLAAPLGARFDQPLLLAVAAEIRLNAIPDGDSPELAGLIDEGLQQISRSVQESKFSLRQLMLMMSSWLGRADYLGWLALESSLKSQPDLRRSDRLCLRTQVPRTETTGRRDVTSLSSQRVTCHNSLLFRSSRNSNSTSLGRSDRVRRANEIGPKRPLCSPALG